MRGPGEVPPPIIAASAAAAAAADCSSELPERDGLEPEEPELEAPELAQAERAIKTAVIKDITLNIQTPINSKISPGLLFPYAQKIPLPGFQ